MESRILKEKGDRNIATIKELNLSNCKSSNISGLSEDWKGLEKLNLTNVGLTTLKGFPRLLNLKKLELSKNNLCEGLDALAGLPKLEELNLSENNIKDLDDVEPLGQVNTLKTLNLKGCDICKLANYEEKLFELIPSLVQLNGIDKARVSKEKVGKKEISKNGKHEEGEDDDDDDDSLSDVDDESLDEEEELEDEDEEENDGDIPLKALYSTINEEMDDDDDFEAAEDEEDEDIDEEEEEDISVNVSQENPEESEEVRGIKRKHDEDN